MILNDAKLHMKIPQSVYTLLMEDCEEYEVTLSHLIECIILTYCDDSKEVEKNEKDQVRWLMSEQKINFKKALIDLLIKASETDNKK